MAAALAAGADGVRVGTRFVAAQESDAHPAYRQALVDAGVDDTLLTTAYGQESGWPDAPHRVLKSAYEAAAATDDAQPQAQWRRDEHSEPTPVGRFQTPPPSRNHSGAIEAMAMYAGLSVADVSSIEQAGAIIRDMTQGAESLLRAAASQVVGP